MKIKDILSGDNINEKKLALEQVLNLSMPEILLNKEKKLTPKEQKKYQKIEKKNKQKSSYSIYFKKNQLLWRRILSK